MFKTTEEMHEALLTAIGEPGDRYGWSYVGLVKKEAHLGMMGKFLRWVSRFSPPDSYARVQAIELKAHGVAWFFKNAELPLGIRTTANDYVAYSVDEFFREKFDIDHKGVSDVEAFITAVEQQGRDGS